MCVNQKPFATLPVFFLNAKPRIQIFLSVTVLNRLSTTFLANLDLWKVLKDTTWFQYSATSGRFRHSLKKVNLIITNRLIDRASAQELLLSLLEHELGYFLSILVQNFRVYIEKVKPLFFFLKHPFRSKIKHCRYFFTCAIAPSL